MIRQLGHLARERGLGPLADPGGGIRPGAPDRLVSFEKLVGVEEFCVEWQLEESPDGVSRGGPPGQTGGGRAA